MPEKNRLKKGDPPEGSSGSAPSVGDYTYYHQGEGGPDLSSFDFSPGITFLPFIYPPTLAW